MAKLLINITSLQYLFLSNAMKTYNTVPGNNQKPSVNLNTCITKEPYPFDKIEIPVAPAAKAFRQKNGNTQSTYYQKRKETDNNILSAKNQNRE